VPHVFADRGDFDAPLAGGLEWLAAAAGRDDSGRVEVTGAVGALVPELDPGRLREVDAPAAPARFPGRPQLVADEPAVARVAVGEGVDPGPEEVADGAGELRVVGVDARLQVDAVAGVAGE